jgi:hypothetical protein
MALISSDLPRENSATKAHAGGLRAVFEQLRDAPVGLRVAQLVLDEPSPKGFETFGELSAPFAVGGKLLGKRHGRFRHKVQVFTLSQRFFRSASAWT